MARSLGCRPLTAMVRVTLPRILPGLGAAAALVFLATVTELTATLLLAPIGTATLATKFWGDASSLSYGAAAPYAGPAVGDLLLLDPEPPADVRWIDVTLPGKNVGRAGAFKIRIPGSALTPGPARIDRQAP